MSALTEEEVRALVAHAVHMARTTTPGNICNEAVVQSVMREHFEPGEGWKSKYFTSDERPETHLVETWLSYPRI